MNNWPTIKLGEVVTHRKEFIEIDDLQTYKRCRVQLHVKGIVLRDEIEGALIKTKQQQVCRTNEFLVAEIDAKVGGYGIVPPELNGAIVSSHYFLFTIDESKLEPQFLGYYIKTPFFRDQVSAQGTTNYAAIRPQHVLNYTIPLPPLLEQQRIVAKIEQLAARIGEARGLKQQSTREAGALLNATLTRILSDNTKNSNWEFGNIPLFAEINPSRKGKINLASTDLVSFIPMKAVDDVTGAIHQAETRQFSEVSKGFTWFVDGDIIFAKITPCMENGKAALTLNLKNGVGFGSTEFHVIRVGEKALAEWLHKIVRSEAFRNDAAAHFKGTAGQQRVPQSFLERKIIAVPPLDEQRRIVTYLDGLQAQVDRLKALQAQTAAELEALLPSILDQAFKGEL